MKKAILFDVDGTLLNARDFIMDALNHTLASHKLVVSSDEIVKEGMGKPLLEFYQTIFPMHDPKIYAQTHHRYQQENFDTLKPFPKVRKTLKSLKALKFLSAAVSNRSRESLITSLKITNLHPFIDLVVSGEEDVKNPKPHQESLLLALKKLKVEPENSYMVGDTETDILAGKNAGVKTIGVTYGFEGPEIKKYDPDFVINNIEELLDILKIPV